MKRNIVAVGLSLLLSAGLWSCSNSSDNNSEKDLSLVQSLDIKAQDLSTAVADISASKGFEIITMDDSNSTKSGSQDGMTDDSRFSASITMDDVKGIYDYNPAINNETTQAKFSFQKIFERTGDSDQFIIRLPKEKATSPWNLYVTEAADSSLVNDFVITTSDFHYNYEGGMQFDYLLDTRLDVEDTYAGDLYVNWAISEDHNFKYESNYAFTDDYSVGVNFQFGDTIHYAYNLNNADGVLFGEEIQINKDTTNHHVMNYTLTIGNIQLMKNSTEDNLLVYRDGVLEEGAVVEVLSEDGTSVDSDIAFCRKGRDLKITFTDGSEVILSDLLGDSLDMLDTIFSSMSNLYFAEHLVNKVAWEVYYTNLANNTNVAE